MAEHQVGNIVYQVSMDVAQLLTAQRQLDSRLGQVEQRFNQTGRSVQGAEKALLSLSRAATAVTAALSIEKIASYADAWVVVNNKLVNAVKTNETLAEVTERVFNIAQNSRASLDSTAALYGRLERATRSYSMSADDVAKLTETVAKGLVVSGATSAESSSVMIQFSQAMASGVLRGEEFNSMSENGSRLIAALSDNLGVNIGQLRKMAAEGKLTAEIVSKAFLTQAGTIAKEFDKTSATMSQSMEMAANNMTKFFGQSTTVQTALKAFNSTLVTVSENMDLVAGAATALAVVMGSRMVGAMILAARQKITNVRASIASAQANKVEAQSALYAANMTLRKAEMDKIAAIEALRHAEAEYAVAKGTDAATVALARLTTARATATTATATYKTAQDAATAAQIAMNGLKSVVSFLGGPLGVITLAASAFFFFKQRTDEARQSADQFSASIDNLSQNLSNMSEKQLKGARVIIANHIRTLVDKKKELESGLRGAETDYNAAKFARYLSPETKQNRMKKATEEMDAYKAEIEKTENEITKLEKVSNDASIAIHEQGKKADAAANSTKKLGDAMGGASKEAGDFLKKLDDQIELLNIVDKKQREIRKAEMQAADAGGNKEQQDKAGKKADEIHNLQEAEKKREEAKRKAESAADKAASDAKNKAKEIEEALKRQQEALDRLNTGYKKNSLEMAKYDARKAMPEGSSESQLKSAEANAERIWLANQEKDDKIKASELDVAAHSAMLRKKEEDDLKRMYDKRLIDEKTFQEQMKAIKDKAAEEERQRKVNETVSPAMKTLGEFDPVQNLINEHERKMAAITHFEQEHTELKEQAEAARAAITKKYQEDLTNAQWDQWKSQNEMYQFLGDAVESLGQRSANSITGLLTGTQTANEAMRNLALTITNEAVSALVQMGMQQIKNMVIGKALATASTATTMAQAAAAQAAWVPAALSASIATLGTAATTGTTAYMSSLAASKAFAIAGARKNGGPVSPNGAYRIGENNKPEIFKANNGHQYMIPGDRGKVVSNRDMGKGGGGVSVGDINISFSVQTQGNFSEQDARLMSGMVKKSIYDVLIDERRPGGMLNQ
ncbi:tape measure protein [Xenorhabdus sp. XENO-10]|uniref:Tape measure protein n=1 Tax=Xenorhabdus yunnanensis TaxID=3025878 RepID=A0ABT5LBB5_9GAMM|nr:tape measure protein [Xenorhabdus yunnanensis]MDC9588352.1 tape measure protein [Xenorhabdus yunnanensis]